MVFSCGTFAGLLRDLRGAKPCLVVLSEIGRLRARCGFQSRSLRPPRGAFQERQRGANHHGDLRALVPSDHDGTVRASRASSAARS
jgi:hypothetical protein